MVLFLPLNCFTRSSLEFKCRALQLIQNDIFHSEDGVIRLTLAFPPVSPATCLFLTTEFPFQSVGHSIQVYVSMYESVGEPCLQQLNVNSIPIKMKDLKLKMLPLSIPIHNKIILNLMETYSLFQNEFPKLNLGSL